MSPPKPTQPKNSTKPAISHAERRRLASCWAKRLASLTGAPGDQAVTLRRPRGAEVHDRHGPVARVLDLPQLGRRRLGHAGHEAGGELHLRRVVLRGDVVV